MRDFNFSANDEFTRNSVCYGNKDVVPKGGFMIYFKMVMRNVPCTLDHDRLPWKVRRLFKVMRECY